jgi:sugar lactone lactonase YvrE
MPAVNITKCAFGGADLTTLYVTSAATGLASGADANAGHLFRIVTGCVGARAAVLDI